MAATEAREEWMDWINEEEAGMDDPAMTMPEETRQGSLYHVEVPSLISLENKTVSRMSFEGSESILLSMHQGNGAQVSGLSAMGFGQSMTATMNPYDSLFNLQAPHYTTLLAIVYGDRYGSQVEKHRHSIAHLEEPEFISLMNFMDNIRSETETTDHSGPYDVLQVLLKSDYGGYGAAAGQA